MLDQFPVFDAVDFEWENMHDGNATRPKKLSELPMRHIEAPEILVDVHRKLGTLLLIDEALGKVCTTPAAARVEGQEFIR